MSKFAGGQLDMVQRPITNLPAPSAGSHAATKDYVDGVVRGLDWKQEVVAASTGNVSLAAPGTALDGVTLTNGDRVLLKDQTAQAENGPYQFNGAGVALTRTLDGDSGPELSGATFTVQRGTVNADRVYRVTADDPLTLGTTPVTFVQVGAGTGEVGVAGNGLTKTGSTYDVGAGTGITVSADAVAIDTAVVTRKVAATIGNGSLQTIDVVHNLGNRDVQIGLFEAATYEWIPIFDATCPDANTVRFVFPTAPAAGFYRAVIQG